MTKNILITIIFLNVFNLSAQSYDEPQNLKEWTAQAGKAISRKMRYPVFSRLMHYRDLATNSYIITINRQGEILEQTLVAPAKKRAYDVASNKALRYANFPKLPSAYRPDKLRISLTFDYMRDESDRDLLHKRGDVMGTQITLLSLEDPAPAE